MPRIIFIPEDPMVWLFVIGLLVAGLVGVAVYPWLWPAPIKKLVVDNRYTQAMAIYAGNLPQGTEPTREQRQDALAQAVDYLTHEHNIPSDQAMANLRIMVAEYDNEQSIDLRHEALAYEQAGAYELALEYFERAARLREEHDREDYEFLQRCIARVRKRVRPKAD
jgi:tetratricopeptide (TPR) repeat protein